MYCRRLGTVRLDCAQWGKPVCCDAIPHFVGGVCTVKWVCTLAHSQVLCIGSLCWMVFYMLQAKSCYCEMKVFTGLFLSISG